MKRTRSMATALGGLAACVVLAAGAADDAPVHPELATALKRLDAWLPGEWDNTPQILVERQLGAPPDGEHEHHYRIITRIDAPQLGSHVYYGELYNGGRGGELVPGQQILYVATVDPERFAVNLKGGGLAEPEKFLQLHRHPELWSEVRMREGAGPCLFLWRLSGAQVVGTLGTEGTCRLRSQRSGEMMTWDAEWVLGPDQLWIFDNGHVDGQGLLMGREDRTHLRGYRLTDYSCEIRGDGRSEQAMLHDRGAESRLADGSVLQLLRGPIARADGRLDQGFALRFTAPGAATAEALAPIDASGVSLEAAGRSIACIPAATAAQPARAVAPAAAPAATNTAPGPAVAAPAAPAIPAAALSCDPERGKPLAALCEACHGLTAGDESISGPNLAGLFGRKAGTAPGYAFSRALRESGITWDRVTLDRFLASPREAVPGNVMSLAGIRNAQQRADLICHLERATAPGR